MGCPRVPLLPQGQFPCRFSASRVRRLAVATAIDFPACAATSLTNCWYMFAAVLHWPLARAEAAALRSDSSVFATPALVICPEASELRTSDEMESVVTVTSGWKYI